jgi:lipoprotein-releasing system permease protein
LQYEYFISTRYLKASKKSFFSVITLISTVGVLIGVTALTAVVSVTGGFQEAYRNRVLSVYPHIMLLPTDTDFPEYNQVIETVMEVEGVVDATPFLRQPLMIYSEDARSMVVLRGMRAEYLANEEGFGQYLTQGELNAIEYSPSEGELPGILLGSELARILRVDLGDQVTGVSHLRGTGIALGPSQMVPTDTQFQVVGVFEVGYNDFDSHLAVTDYRTLQQLLNRGDQVTGIDVRVADVFQTRAVGRQITGRLPAGDFQALGWEEIHRNLFRSLAIQKIALALVMTFIVIVASFNIVSTLVLMVLDKTREIAILKSMGATNGGIMRIFMIQGLTIGTIGAMLGVLGGYLICILVEHLNFGLDPTVYKIASLPVDVRLSELLIISLVAISISFLATLYPSLQASRLNTVDGLRVE